MNLILAKKENLSAIMRIIKDAQIHLATQEIDQWQNGYPDESAIRTDISNQESYLVQNIKEQHMGTAMFTMRTEPTYASIEGSWITAENTSYGVIHRMAVSNKFRNKGVAKFIFKICEQKLIEQNISSMRIDTHEDNLGMKGLLKQLNYVYCGVIYLANGDKRLAFEKILK